MRASDYIGREIRDHHGARVGIITDLRCVQDGPPRGQSAMLRVDAALVSSRHTGATLGYDRRDRQGPWMIRVGVRRLHRNLRIVPWSSIVDNDGQLEIPEAQ
jgi:hypothetical protein